MNDSLNIIMITETEDSCQFSVDLEINEAEYEAMRSREGSLFLPTVKTSDNDRSHITYSISGRERLSSVFAQLNNTQILRIIPDLISELLTIKDHGVLKLKNVAADPSWMFYDSGTQSIQLLYMPAITGIYSDDEEFESVFRKELAGLINQSFEEPDVSLMILAEELSDPDLELDYFKSYIPEEAASSEKNKDNEENRVLCLKPLDLRHTQRIEISRLPFLIGRKEQSVDGVITESKLVSRVHCRIDKKSDSYTITDLASKNGTRINTMRLEPELEYLLQAGDIVRIADIDFEVDWNYTGERNAKRWSG